MVSKLKESGAFYTLEFDESPTKQNKNQMDVWLRFFDPDRSLVLTRFLRSSMLGHATAEIISEDILQSIRDFGLSIEKLLSVSSDGPNVTKKVRRLLDAEKRKICGDGLVDLGTCPLHIVHNAYGKGLDEYGKRCERFAIDVYHFFRSGCRREDFAKIQELMDVFQHQFLKHVSCRWLTFVPVLQRIEEQHDSLVRYLTELGKKDRTMEKSARFRSIMSEIQEKDHLVLVKFLIEIGRDLQPFLNAFQTKAPMIHRVYDEMMDIRKILCRFV